MEYVASPLALATEFWQYLRSVLTGMSYISITRYQTSVTREAQWSHLNKRIVKLYILEFTDLAKGITNDTLAFEWGDKRLYWKNKRSKYRFFHFQWPRLRQICFMLDFEGKNYSFLMCSFRVTLGAEMAQSALRPDYGLNYQRIVVCFPEWRKRFVFSEVFSPSLGPAQPPKR
jgi:hypothetical protein